eukprot:Unigene1055_Nuclearia_a/m.3368 Unigene1055_Nuclearia_a/g.3368  ORF Unigene1055_Nuclearia_a/g.3368 Unigene1055_Nuclearia_a/m.3368 type:complete len:414 (-) Unigene1055_Nuclearia_a:236-1477(-)
MNMNCRLLFSLQVVYVLRDTAQTQTTEEPERVYVSERTGRKGKQPHAWRGTHASSCSRCRGVERRSRVVATPGQAAVDELVRAEDNGVGRDRAQECHAKAAVEAAHALRAPERAQAAKVVRLERVGGLGLNLRLDNVGGEHDRVVADAADRARCHDLQRRERLLAAVRRHGLDAELEGAEPGRAAKGLAGERGRVALVHAGDAVGAELAEDGVERARDLLLHLHAALDELDGGHDKRDDAAGHGAGRGQAADRERALAVALDELLDLAVRDEEHGVLKDRAQHGGHEAAVDAVPSLVAHDVLEAVVRAGKLAGRAEVLALQADLDRVERVLDELAGDAGARAGEEVCGLAVERKGREAQQRQAAQQRRRGEGERGRRARGGRRGRAHHGAGEEVAREGALERNDRRALQLVVQ